MYLASIIVIIFSVIALVSWGSYTLFGKTIGSIITISVAGLIYLALTIYSNKQEKILLKELNELSPEDREDVLRKAKEKGIIE